jgi:hypothetical protein
MKINLLRDYCGRIINDNVLLKGVQDVEDTVGAYLVGKGYAVTSEPLPLAVADEGEWKAEDDEPHPDDIPLPEITEDVVTQERTVSSKVPDERPKPLGSDSYTKPKGKR